MTDLETLKQLFSDEKIYLVDVREESEWEKGHILGAYFLPMSRLANPENLSTVPRERPLYFYCSSGRRARMVKQLLSPYIEHIYLMWQAAVALKS